MKRTKHSIQRFSTNESVALARYALSVGLGMSYEGKRDLYKALGYPTLVSPTDMFEMYKREDFSKVVVDKIPKATWTLYPMITDDSDNFDSPFSKAWNDLVKQHRIYAVLSRLDRLLGMCPYCVLFLG
jgi:hypothetical protein